MKMKFCILGLALFLAACNPQPAKEESATTPEAAAMDQPAEEAQPAASIPEPAAPEATPEPVKEEPVNPNLKTCVFKSITEESCARTVFDCVTFDNPDVTSLPQAQLILWGSLMSFGGEGDFPSANPKYAGKKFNIEFTTTKGLNCAALMSQGTEKTTIYKIVSFQLAK